MRLLDADPELGRGLSAAHLDRFAPYLRVGVRSYDCGARQPDRLALQPETLGLLVLDGLLLRELSLNRRCCAELLGPGDLLRPWADPEAPAANGKVEWEVVDGPLRGPTGRRRRLLSAGGAAVPLTRPTPGSAP